MPELVQSRSRLNDTDLEAALRDCASEPVHIPGHIQPHGALIAIDPASLKVCYASENAADFIGIPAEHLFSGTLPDHFTPEQMHNLANYIRTGPPEGAVSDLGPFTVGGRTLWVSACPSDRYAIIMFEPLDNMEIGKNTVLAELSELTLQTQRARTSQKLYEATVQTLRTLSGYDRVHIYRFDHDGNGIIEAESIAPGLEPLLGLRFPRWDIPEQARAIMRQIPMRFIADAAGVPVPVLQAKDSLPQLDMTAAPLRGTSSMHTEYLRNMGHHGSMTLHLSIDGQVWGVISLLHRKARVPQQRVRQICLHFSRMFEAKLSHLLLAERLEQLNKADQLRQAITKDAAQHSLEGLFKAELLARLSTTLHADGAALAMAGKFIRVGETPEEPELVELMHTQALADGIFSSSSLAHDRPQLAGICGDDLPGLLFVPLPEKVAFMFFRKGRDQTLVWAGRPDKGFQIKDGHARLQPRGSFAAYETLVRGTAEPWGEDALRIADDIWALLVTAERRDLVEKTNRQQKILIDELNHRVRNILALVRSLSQQTMNHHESIESYVRALEARIAAVATAHDLGVEPQGAGVTAGQIIKVEAAPYDQKKQRVLLSGEDMGIRNDLAPLFALVIHELMTNAVKYGALSNKVGRVNIDLSVQDYQFRIHWKETGGPPVMPGRKYGFGTTLIETSVPYELGGSVKLEFDESGVEAVICLPNTTMMERTALASETVPATIFSPLPATSERPQIDGHCLLVEDNFVVSLDTSNMLKKIGLTQIETASNAEEAIEKIDLSPPQLAILDVNLGAGQTSGSVAMRLQGLGIPFIFVTGYGDAAPLTDDFKSVATLKKPVRADELAEAVHRVSLAS